MPARRVRKPMLGQRYVEPPPNLYTVDDKTLFDRVAEDIIHDRRDLFDTLSSHEKNIVLRWMSEALVDGETDNALHNILWEIDFIRKPVSVERFLTEPYYLGRSCEDLHERWLADIINVFDPRKQYVEWVLTGAIGIGKCLRDTTLIPTNAGFLTIEEVVKEHAQADVQAEPGVRRVTQTHSEGVTATIKITTKHGHTLEGRADHRVRVLRNLRREWVRLGDIQSGDTVLMQPSEVFGDLEMPDHVAELLGWAVAEAVVYRDKGEVRLSLHKEELPYVSDLAKQACEWGGGAYSVFASRNVVSLRGGSWADMLAGRVSHNKEIPKAVRMGTRRVICQFLRGLFSGDGYVGMCPELTTVSSRLADQVTAVLVSMGYYVSLTCKDAFAVAINGDKTQGRTAYMVRIVGSASKAKFAEEIGFAHESKQKKLVRQGKASNQNSDHTYAFKLCQTDVAILRGMQPMFRRGSIPAGLDKKSTPRGILRRLHAGQGCTVTLLRTIKDAGGVLPDVLDDIETGSILFDTVDKVSSSEAVCYDLTVEGDPSYVANGFISHNTTLACAAMAYTAYHLSCLRDPAIYYGSLADSLMVLGVYSITKRQVADAGYFKLKGFLDSSPYFRHEFPRSSKIDSKVVFMRHPLQIVPGSLELHALGLDLFAFLMDEVNFMRVKDDKESGKAVGQAYDLYNATRSRIVSRYIRPGGTVPGKMLLMSSRNSQTSFLEEKLAKRDPAQTYVSDYALWDVKPKERFPAKRFFVEVGDRFHQSRILKDSEKPREGAKTVGIPDNAMIRKIFTDDVDQGLRDMAGVATFNVSPLLRDRQSLRDAIRDSLSHPFTRHEITLDVEDDVELDEFFNLREVCQVESGRWVPRLNPLRPRYVHVDQSLTGDCAGIAMGHVSGLVRRVKPKEDGTATEIVMPFVIIDFMIRIRPPVGSEIDLVKIQSFVTYLRRLYPIRRVTFDGFQSRTQIQLLKRQNVEAGLLSVDRDDGPYMNLRAALSDRRMAYYEYEPFMDEMLDLERNIKTKKVDHPTTASKGGKGSKDVSDAVCGVVELCMTDPRASREVPYLKTDGSEVRKGVINPTASEIERGKPGKQVRLGQTTIELSVFENNLS